MPASTEPTACSADPTAFDTNEDSRELRALCFACPLFFDCRTWALEAAIEEGFVGGMSRRERRKARKKMAAAA